MSEQSEQRLDIWLWRARWFKSRSDAVYMITKKGVRIDRTGLVRKCIKPGASIAIGDILIFRKGSEVKTIRVLDMPHRRGPATEAQACYELVDEAEE